MTTRIKSSRIILGNSITEGFVYFSDEKILAVTKEELPYDAEYDVGNSYVSPGLIDLHTHGGGGYDFIDGEEEVLRGAQFHLSHGTTSLCPTISAAPFATMAKAVDYVAGAKQRPERKPNLLGAHLEGPYLSAEQCGAQCPDFITPPIPEDYEPLLARHARHIARWTYAPESDPDGRFCRTLKQYGVLPSAGHTNAIYDEMKVAMEAGCSLVTHLYSCTSTVTRDHGFRRLGVIETALLRDDLYAEIIADGKHLPADLVRLILKAKGSDRVILITDSLALAGTSVTTGRMVNTDFIIEDGVCKLADRSAFAGSIASADVLIRFMIQEVGVGLTEAVKMMTKTPAALFKLPKGVLAPGMDADIIVFDDDIRVSHVFVMGQVAKEP
ncbi:MAG: amidohydrolase family protein [Clostridia bacterium]|nr:amidohydrolase family protein [Clostridia bacterium]